MRTNNVFQRQGRVSVVLLVVAGLAWGLAGCGQQQTRGLFTLSELKDYNRLAVFGLTAEQEQVFMACYTKGFPGQSTTFVERAKLHEVIKEQDLLKPALRLDEETRAKIKRIFGVEALILCDYSPAAAVNEVAKLRVRIVDSATGAISGSVIVEGHKVFDILSAEAIRALRTDLYGG
jgi:hypothetical protein